MMKAERMPCISFLVIYLLGFISEEKDSTCKKTEIPEKDSEKAISGRE